MARITNSWGRRLGALAAAGVLLAPLAAGAAAPPADTWPTVRFRHYGFPLPDRNAQMWSALHVGSNGRLYIGLCTHGDAGMLYEFDPDRETMRLLANLTVLAGERGRGIWTTGKIHVQMQELDGYVYFGSLCEDNGPPAMDFSSFKGSHWYRVHLATGRVEQRAPISRYWGLLGQTMDAKRRRVYGLAEDGRLYCYHLDQDWTEELGRVDDWDICRTIFSDDEGNVYGSYAPGLVWKYDAAKDCLIDFDFLRLPVINQSRTMAKPMLDRKAQWRIVEWDPVERVAYGIVGGSNRLFRFDVRDGPEGSFTMLPEMCAPPFRGGDPFRIPPATLAMALAARERQIYYLPIVEGDFDYGAVRKFETGATAAASEMTAGGKAPRSFLVSFDLKSGVRRDLGLLRAQDGRYAYGQGAAKVDAKGRLWFVGAFEEPDPARSAQPESGQRPYSLGLGCYVPSP